MSNKLVSIITPCYNSEEYIGRLMDSVLNQDYPDIELIVIDDGSTDKSLQLVNSYKEKFKKKLYKLQIVSKDNGGVASAINAGLKILTGDYLTFIDSDDYITYDSISKRVSALEEDSSLDAVYSATQILKEEKKRLRKVRLENTKKIDLFDAMLNELDYSWPPVSYLLRVESFLKSNPNREIVLNRAGQNIQLFLPFWHWAKVGYVAETLACVVARGDSHSRKQLDDQELQTRLASIKIAYLDTIARMDIDEGLKNVYLNKIHSRFKDVNETVFIDINDGSDELTKLYKKDKERFEKYMFPGAHDASQEQLASRLNFSAHSLEKSLSNSKFEAGHGFMVVGLLRGFLDVYLDKGYDRNHLAYTNTLSVLKEFYLRHNEPKHKQKLEEILGDKWVYEIQREESDIGGAEDISIDDKQNNHRKNFEELSRGRFAVRSYSDKPVDKSLIDDAIRIALKTPTVCNRQPVRVRVFYKKDVIARILEVQGGIAHYDTPPVLLLVTADDNAYVGPNERNQGYIDGGLFAMSILYALEYGKLAACPLHAMFETERDLKIRGMIGIPDNEKLITFISAGHFSETNPVCKSFRYPIGSILSEVDKINDFRIEFRSESAKSIIDNEVKPMFTVNRRVVSKIRKIKSLFKSQLINISSVLGRAIDRFKYSRYDGAILTLTGYFNYGNVIQRYALQKFLFNRGLKFVSYVDNLSAPRDMYRVGRKTKLKKPLRALKRIARNQKPYWYTPSLNEIYPEHTQLQHIVSFVNKYIKIKQPDPKDNFKNYIVGSDQVWRNWWQDRRALRYYFIDFITGKNINKISYAASFGNDKIELVMDDDMVKDIKPLIDDFDHISVREKSARRLIKKTWDIDTVSVVLDPTMLLTASQYSSLIEESEGNLQKIEPLFSYILGDSRELNDFVNSISSKTQMKHFGIGAHNSSGGVHQPVELWLKGFRDAKLVVTNSFHGMMFSIINNTDFIIVGRKSGGLSRVTDFLDEYGIKERFVDETDLRSFDATKLKPIHWKSINEKIERRRKESGDWLIDSINKDI